MVYTGKIFLGDVYINYHIYANKYKLLFTGNDCL